MTTEPNHDSADEDDGPEQGSRRGGVKLTPLHEEGAAVASNSVNEMEAHPAEVARLARVEAPVREIAVAEPVRASIPDPDDDDGPEQGARPSALRGALKLTPAAAPPKDAASMRAKDLTEEHTWLAGVVNMALVGALLVVLVCAAQAALLFNQIALLPIWVRPIAYAIFGIVAVAGLFFLARGIGAYLRLKISPKLHSRIKEELQTREDVRSDVASSRLTEARAKLNELLVAYPLEKEAQRQRLRQSGFHEAEIETLWGAYGHLRGPEQPKDDAKWVLTFERDFLAVLDEVAKRRTMQRAKAVALFTAASPRGSLHTLAVLVGSYRLIADLCEIYQVRANSWDTAMIMGRILVNVAASVQLDQATDLVGNTISSWINQTFHSVGALASGVLGKFAGKAGEGLANGWLLWRLSIRTRAYLRPIRLDVKAEEHLPEPGEAAGATAG